MDCTSVWLSHMGQQSEWTRLRFDQETGTSETAADNVYIDLAACMTVVNRRQYHHTTRNGIPLCYAFVLSSGEPVLGGTIRLEAIANTWTTRNAVKMTAEAWKAQLKHANIKLRDLPTYGKRLRVGFDRTGLNGTGAPLDEESWLNNQLYPLDVTGTGITGGYTASDGAAISYEHAQEITQVVVDDGAGNVTTLRVCIGTGSSTAGNTLTFGCIEEFLKARRSAPDVDVEPLPTSSLMSTLFATAEELSDDILEAVQDDMEYRPYNETQYMVNAAEIMPVAHVTSSAGVAPCGLLRVTPQVAGEMFFIDVVAIYEM